MYDFPDLKVVDENFYLQTLNDKNFVHENKHDGTAAQIVVHGSSVNIFGRGMHKDGSISNYTTKFPEIVKALENLKLTDATLLGELCVFDGKFDSFNLLQQRTTRQKEIDLYARRFPAKLMLFDVMWNFKRGFTGNPYTERREILRNLSETRAWDPERLGIVPRKHKSSSKKKLWNRVVKNKLEGVVIKHVNAEYGEGQYKFKLTNTQEVFAGGYQIGTGRLEQRGWIGSIQMYQYIDPSQPAVFVGKVGSGLNDEVRELLTPKLALGEPIVFEVKLDSITKNGIFRHPRFLRLRTDKSTKQCIRK